MPAYNSKQKEEEPHKNGSSSFLTAKSLI